ncbi:MAG: ABC transporter permease, partial [Gemmatimonadota bacterium]|nr:ABC transporter permease [Gemmatimonadota bacterium]
GQSAVALGMMIVRWLAVAAAVLLLGALAKRALRHADPGGGPWRAAMHRLAEDRAAIVALHVLIALALIAIVAPWLTPYGPNELLDIRTLRSLPPSLAHPFGTDFASRDVLSRMIYGARISLSVALLAMTISLTVGVAYGALAGFYGGVIDDVMMRVLDAALSTPRILILMVVLLLWGAPSIMSITLILGLTGWFGVSRLVRGEVSSAKTGDAITAARALGAGDARLLWRHILPAVMAPVLVTASLGVGNVIVLEAGLSLLNVGLRPPTASWGSIFYDGSDTLLRMWWLTLFPGLAIVATVTAFNVLGDGLRDALDPRQVVRT